MKDLPKAFEAKNYEEKIGKRWEESGFFNPDVCVKAGVTEKDASYFSIVLPPPNVTGTLHMGHAAMLAIEDIMVRYHRMKGDRTLWIPGTDHAAIATESKVESILIKEKKMAKPKQEMGREAFLNEVRKFAKESHDTIVNQCKKMGASLDWSREAFTLDDQRNRAVRAVFKKMFDDGLIYRGFRVINWSVKGQSTCSDDELVYVERPGKLYYFKYSKDFPITIATTRPETKLGDTAVAVHPDDKRYKQFIGKTYDLEFVGEKIKVKIIADDGIDMNYGTGALGVTPAHSAVDFAMYEKQKAAGNPIDLIQVIGEDGKMTHRAGAYSDLEVEKARAVILENLRVHKLLEKEEDIIQNIGTSDRFNDIVEPLPKLQWFIDVNKKFKLKESKIKGVKSGASVTLKELMQKVVNSKQITIIPNQFEKTYFHWIDNLRPWNISRQIWYGHQVPVWYRKEEIYCGINAPEGEGWVQDKDTLDTWFSSGLWTFSTLGWPDENGDLENFHPTSVLETGHDILFFWVARMILMTTYTLGCIPFETVYLHGLVRDEQGRKMSKSLGNVINPLDMIEKFGTDATRLSLVLGSTPGIDLKLSEEKIAGFRNFTNKLWNISRFMLINIEKPSEDIKMPAPKTDADAWILEKMQNVIKDVTAQIENYNYSMAGEILRDFTWGELADWYLEIAKIEGGKSLVLNYLLNTVLKLWHPFMPFVTETIWEEVYESDALLMVEKWPKVGRKKFDSAVQFEIIKNVVTAIRSWRSENKIDAVKLLSAVIVPEKNQKLVIENAGIIEKLARLEKLVITEKMENHNGKKVFLAAGMEIAVDFEGVVDKGKETKRLKDEIDSVTKYITGLEAKLSNADFVSRAPAVVVEKEKAKLLEVKDKLLKFEAQLKSLN
ncbi:MAG: valine--tRNA ligase [Candidatus Magasanikbacteria bacterium]